MTSRQRLKRRLLLRWWKLLNATMRSAAGWAPWWVILETTGRRSGCPRTIPLARGPFEGEALWLIAVHGEHSAWVRNIRADSRVRVRHRGRWRSGRATIVDMEPARLAQFNAYARSGPRVLGIDPVLVRVDLGQPGSRTAMTQRSSPRSRMR